MLQFTGEKMSKSVGNFITIEDFLAEHKADVLRLIVLNGHYRSPLVFNEEVIEQAARALDRLQTGLRPASGDGEAPAAAAHLQEAAEASRTGFEQAMDDDFNTPVALSHLFEFVRVINTARDDGVGADELEAAQTVLRALAARLGLRLEADRSGPAEAAPFIELLLEVRKGLREAKQFELADQIRDQLAELGVHIEDGKQGTTWRVGRTAP
jgi:cysteinyl-tRNA synthetase